MMNISHDYAETRLFISDGDADKKVSYILNMMEKNKNNNKDVIVLFNFSPVSYSDNYHSGDTLCSSSLKRIKKGCSIIINNIHEVYGRPDKIRGIALSGNDTNPEISERYHLITTNESAKTISDKRGSNISSVQQEITKGNASVVQPEEMTNMISSEETCDSGKTESISTETPTAAIPAESLVPPECPVFLHHATEGSETKNPLLNSVLNQRENGDPGKTLFLSTDTGKYPVSQENNKADYYLSYYFRQKYQSPEPVYIYRDQSGRFKLDAHSELVKRRLKSAMDVNAVDNIDIL